MENPVQAGEGEVASVATEAEAVPESVKPMKPGEVPPQEPPAPPSEPLPGPPLTPEAPDNLIAVKYESLDRELERMGHPPLQRPGTERQQDAMDEAMRQHEADPEAGRKLVDELTLRPRAWASVTEQFVAAIEIARRKINYGKRVQDFLDNRSGPEANGLRSAMEAADLHLQEALWAAGQAQSAWGRTGRASQTYINIEDFSLVSMLQRYQANVNKGEPLTPEQTAKVAELYEKLKAKQAQIDQLTEAVESGDAEKQELVKLVDRLSADVDQAQAKLQRRNSTTLAKVKKALSGPAAEARKRLADRGRIKPTTTDANGVERSMSGPTPEMVREAAQDIADLSVIVADWLAGRAMKFGEFTNRMVSEFGDWVRPLVPRVWRKARQAFYETAESVSGRQAKTAETVVSEIDTEAGVTKKDVWDLARAHIIGGLRGKDVLEAVHKDITEAGIEMTFDEVATLFTDYGKATYPSKEEIAKELQRVRELERAGLKLRDVLAGRMPKRTGYQRGEMDAEVREAEREFREAFRASGLQDESEQALKTARGAAKRRMRNRIEDLRRAIATRTKITNERTPLELDQEMLDLRAELEAAQADYDSVFGRGLTEEQRQRNLLKTINRQIAEEERMIQAGQARRPERAPVAETDEIRQRRTRLAELREQRKALASPDEINEARVRRYLKTIARSKAELQRRIAEKDYAPRPRPEPPLDDRVKDAMRERDALRRQFNLDMLNAKLAQRSLPQKIMEGAWDAFTRLPRAAWASTDVSGIGRQGLWSLIIHPRTTIPQIFKAGFAFSEKRATRLEEAMEADSLFPAAMKAGLSITRWRPGHSLAEMEEMYRSRLAGFIPGVKHSERAYVTYLNALRMAHFKLAYAALEAKEGGLTEANLAEAAGHINQLTGRGRLPGKVERYAGALLAIFFSPRFWWSRLQVLGGMPLSALDAATGWRLGPEETKAARKIIALERGRLALGVVTIYSLLKIFSAMSRGDDEEPLFDVSFDPRSSDFGKIRFRNGTRIDIGAGALQNIVMAARIITGEAVNTTTGEVVKLRGPGKTPMRSIDSDVWRMFRSKMSPTLGTVFNIAGGENVVGDPTTPESELLGLYIPLPVSSSYESYKQLGITGGTAATLLELFGFGSATYGPDVKDESLRGDVTRQLIEPVATGILGVDPSRYDEFYED